MSQQVHCLSRQASGNFINIESLNFTPPNIPLLIVIKKQNLNTLILYDHKILLQEVFGSSMILICNQVYLQAIYQQEY